MTDHPSHNEPIEWFLARDGQQHGPLSESEMRAFVDMGHLRDDDLIWRPGFPEWRPAPQVFAIRPPAARVPAPEVRPQPQPAPQAAAVPNPRPESVTSEPRPHEAAAASVITADLLSPDQLRTPTAAEPAAPAAARPSGPVATPQAAPDGSAHPRGQNPFGWPADGARPQPEPAQPDNLARAGAAARGNKPSPYSPDFDDDDHEDDAPKRRFGFGRIAAALVLASLVGAGVAAALRPDKFAALVSAPLARVASVTADGVVRTAPLAAGGGSADSVDQAFQRTAIWRHIKSEFPEWYGERVQETAKFSAEKRGEGVIAKHLAEAIVTLRRKHADQALTASPERLRFVATAFLDNLQLFAKKDVETCYGFISQGETYPPVLEMLQKADGNDGLQKQVMAIFDAIADGRKAPQSYLPPRKSDYDALAAELNARGWSEADLRTFSDPRALGRATPDQVCRMVQDWFAAQIAIKDPDAQLRLLVESLRPVVAG